MSAPPVVLDFAAARWHVALVALAILVLAIGAAAGAWFEYRAVEARRAGLELKLALYMGHVSIVSTAYYLHFIPEVAALANERFDRRFSHLVGPGVL